ncbi:uncharacterized protein LOC143301227 [Babylonia areolata]|uniref:uncharacterized protein LOC143301227 n=1 Tax=Babylonia areolata TaxID=304850 RepID=UPI003FD4AB9D
MTASRSTSVRTLLMTAAALCTLSEAGLSRSCPDGQFFNPDAGSCLACGSCPKNQIIRVPCSQHSDTVCGPFFEFYKFHQAPRPTLDIENLDFLEEEEEDEEGGRWRYGVAHPDHDVHEGVTDGAGQPRGKPPPREQSAAQDRGDGADVRDAEEPEPSRAGKGGADQAEGGAAGDRGGQKRPSLQTPAGEEENQWKVLALALIIVLCVVCIVLIGFISVICYLRASRPTGKSAHFGATASGSHTGTAQHRTALLRYAPVPACAQAHTTSTTSGPGERSDSPTATSSSGQTRRGDSDGALQTTTSSSEYVYFRSPQNGNDAVDV